MRTSVGYAKKKYTTTLILSGNSQSILVLCLPERPSTWLQFHLSYLPKVFGLLTHFRLNSLPTHYIWEESNFDLRYTRLCDLDIPEEKMVELFANSGNPDQTPRSAASDLGLHCLPITVKGSPDNNESKLLTILVRLFHFHVLLMILRYCWHSVLIMIRRRVLWRPIQVYTVCLDLSL